MFGERKPCLEKGMMYADPKYAMRMTVLFFKSDSPSGIFSFIYTYI